MDERRRLSIREQTLFPFQPMIDSYKARKAAAQSGVELAANDQSEPAVTA